MPKRKKYTDYDYINFRCKDLEAISKELKEFQIKFKKGEVNLYRITQLRRWIFGHSKDIRKFLENIKKNNLKLN